MLRAPAIREGPCPTHIAVALVVSACPRWPEQRHVAHASTTASDSSGPPKSPAAYSRVSVDLD
jgi:hypothetical protein